MTGAAMTVTGRSLIDPELRAQVRAKLELERNPEPISAWLRRAYLDRLSWHVCHETIYQALYNAGKSGLNRQLTKRLRTGRPLRRRRRRPDQRGPFHRPFGADRRPGR